MLSLDDLNALNPWWTAPRWTAADDPHLSGVASARFDWDPRPFDAADLASAAVFTLRGPRQSGKTTLTKRLIAERVAAGLGRRTCFLTLRVIDNADGIRAAIETVLRLWPAEEPASPWLFVLDELTFVKGWANALAHLREFNPEFRRATVILTGSSAADLVASSDDMQGRRGRWHRPLDRLHMPMTFRDFLAARSPRLDLGDQVRVDDLLTSDGRRTAQVLSLRGGEIDQYLGEYARCGGLPAPVTDSLIEGRLQLGTVMELWRGLSADVRRLDRSEARLSKLISRTVVALGQPTNLTDVARDMDVSKPTATDYIDLLAKSFGLVVLHERDQKRQSGPSLTKTRKHYFGDPAFAAIPAAQGGPTPTDPALVENLLLIALFRHVERNALESFAVPQNLFVWRSDRGREIDFVADTATGALPIESKYAQSPDGKDYESMTKAFGFGVMASRQTVNIDREILTVPAGVLLAMIG
jgi:hypothetical protein